MSSGGSGSSRLFDCVLLGTFDASDFQLRRRTLEKRKKKERKKERKKKAGKLLPLRAFHFRATRTHAPKREIRRKFSSPETQCQLSFLEIAYLWLPYMMRFFPIFLSLSLSLSLLFFKSFVKLFRRFPFPRFRVSCCNSPPINLLFSTRGVRNVRVLIDVSIVSSTDVSAFVSYFRRPSNRNLTRTFRETERHCR